LAEHPIRAPIGIPMMCRMLSAIFYFWWLKMSAWWTTS